jgi:hypothetical protein
MPAAAPCIPHTAARALFAQECTHDTHYMNHKGDLYTALITGGDRLLMLKNGSVVAQSGPLFDHASSPPPPGQHIRSYQSGSGTNTQRSTVGTACAPAWRAPCVYVVSICRFTDDVLRLAVATTVGIFVFEFDDAGLLWRDTRSPSFWRTADRDGEDDVFGPGSPATSVRVPGSPASHNASGQRRGNAFQAPVGSLLKVSGSTKTTGSSSPAVSSPARVEGHLERRSGVTGRLRWRRVEFRLDSSPAPSSTSPGLAAGAVASSSHRTATVYSSSARVMVPGSAGANTESTRSGKPVYTAPVRVAVPARASAVRAMEFVTEDALCVVLESETVLILLGNSSSEAASPRNLYGAGSPTGTTSTTAAATTSRVADRVVWRCLGAYRSLAVCRVHHHIALALGHSAVVVFPSRILAGDGQDSSAGLPGDDDGGRASTAFSTATSFSMANPATAGAVRGMLSDSHSSSVVPTPAFSPTNHPMSAPVFPGGNGVSSNFLPAPSGGKAAGGTSRQAFITLARQGLTASVGIYHITDMRWHRVSSHTLLCVTCSHPSEEAAYMMLYTVQSLSTTRRYTNVMEEHADGGWGLCRGGYDGDRVMDGGGVTGGGAAAERARNTSEKLVQLVPAGVIALTYTSTSPSSGPSPCAGNTATLMPTNTATSACDRQQQEAAVPSASDHSALPVSPTATTTWGGAPPPPVAEMHTSLVPNFSRSAEANSMGSRMEFLHVEGDGTVRTSSYSFGRQKHASFAKQRAVGLACTKLLQPLLHLYGSLVRVTVLPTWRTRPIELGHHTGKQPQAVEVLLNASRRYRLVLRFTSGVLLSVMVDLSAALFRVESYLALGHASLLSLRPISSIPELTADDVADGVLSQAAVGTTTMLLVGLLDFPPPSSPPVGKPRRLLTASPSFLEEGEVDVWRHAQSSKTPRSSSSAAFSMASAFHSRSTSWEATASPGAVASAIPARAVWGVVLFQVEPSGLQARVLTIAPLSEIDVAGVTDAGAATELAQRQAASDAAHKSESGCFGAPSVALAGNNAALTETDASAASAVSEDDVAHFIKDKCPEKVKFIPALLKATQQDAGKLMAQLIAKYGPLEKKAADEVPATQHTQPPSSALLTTPAKTAPQVLPTAFLAPSALSSGCLTERGEVVLLLTVPSNHTTACSADEDGGSCVAAAAPPPPVALVRIRPPCLETFAPVHKLVAAGSSQVPFVPVAADYVFLPGVLQQRWWPRCPSVSTFPTDVSADAQAICAAYRLCRRIGARLRERKTIQCDVVVPSGGTTETVAHPYVRVRSPLAPEGKEATSTGLTALQYLPLPEGVGHSPSEASMVVEEVKGTLQVNNDVVIGVLCRPTYSPSPLHCVKPQPLSVAVSNIRAQGVLYLYGCPAVQSLAANSSTKGAPTPDRALAKTAGSPPSSAFALEATLAGVQAFYLSTSGEVVVLRSSITTNAPAEMTRAAEGQGLRFERWLRCFPGGSSTDRTAQTGPCGAAASSPHGTREEESVNGYAYLQDPTWCPPCIHTGTCATGEVAAVTAVTTIEVAGAWEENVAGLSAAAKLTSSRTATRPVLYATADNTFIHLRQMPLRSGGDGEQPTSGAIRHYSASSGDDAAGGAKPAVLAGIPQYHPDAIMQLIGMARWSVLAKVLTLVLSAVKTTLATSRPLAASSTDKDPAEAFTLVFSQPPDELARRLCVSAVSRGFHDRPQVVQYDDVLFRVTPPRLSAEALADDVEAVSSVSAGAATTTGNVTSASSTVSCAAHHLYDLTATCGHLFAELTELLPQVTLTGLSSQEQLTLLCILQALRDTLPLSRSVDEAAARYLFFARLMSLGRRLRLPNIDIAGAGGAAAAAIPGVPVNSVLYFEVGRTATRTVSTAAYLWAAMSDSQSTLVSLLFDKTSAMYLDGGSSGGGGTAHLGTGEITWEQVEQSGAAFWVRSAVDLRAMADRVARHQYQCTKDLTACALMYCTARKVGTLAALAKAQNNPRLYAFFSRDFAHDEHHRAAASANAYAAISKNMPQYGAAFFLLAGDVRSAVQVLLQRCRDPFIALFVLRAAGEVTEEVPTPLTENQAGADSSNITITAAGAGQPETLLQWYVSQRTIEVDACGPLDMWETACLSWMDVTPQTSPAVTVQRRIAALQRIAAHPTAHPEALCALRYARDGVAALAYRGNLFLSPAREVVCLLRLGRYCLAHRLNLSGYLHYRDAERLLHGLRVEASARRNGLMANSESEGLSSGLGLRGGPTRRAPAPPKMAADFNTGTLTFRGFDSDDDDDGNSGNGAGLTQGEAGVADETAALGEDTFVLDSDAVAAVQAEIQYAYLRSGAVFDANVATPATTLAATTTVSGSYEDVLRRMLLCFTAASSFMSTSSATLSDSAEVPYADATAFLTTTTSTSSSSSGPAGSSYEPFQHLLAQLFRRLISDMPGGQAAETVAAPSSASTAGVPRDVATLSAQAEELPPLLEQQPTNTSTSTSTTTATGAPSAGRPVLNGSIREPMKCAADGWYSLCIPLLHLLLGKVALREANYLVLLCLQRIPVSTEGVLEAAEQAGLLHGLFARVAGSCGTASGSSSASWTTNSASTPAPAAAPSFLSGRPSPLHLPLVAFFMLLGRHIMRLYKEACEAEEERQGSTARSRRTHDNNPRNAVDGDTDKDDDEGSTNDRGDLVHQNMFEALVAAAAAEKAGSQNAASAAGAPDGGRRPTYPFDGVDGDSNALEGADDEELLISGGGGARGDDASVVTEAAQVSLLLSCCQSQLQLRLLEHLRQLARAELQAAVHTPTTKRALDAGVLYSDPLPPPAQAMLIQRRILLAVMLLDVTAQWCALSEETMLRLYTALPRCAPGPLTDPNGVFLEVRVDVLRMRAVLVTLLASPQGVTEAAAIAAIAATSGTTGGAAREPKTDSTSQLSVASHSFTNEDIRSGSGGHAVSATTTWLEENTVMLLELCTTQLELYWTLPSHALTQCRQLAAPTRAALRLLRRSTASHSSARKLLEGMLRPLNDCPALLQRSHTAQLFAPEIPGSSLARAATTFPSGKPQTSAESPRHTPAGKDAAEEVYCPALSFLQLAWMRRHHTHALLRRLLLGITLDMGRTNGQHPLLTDRLILTQHSHPVTGVQFDLSSCDSVVCTTEAGTSVGHGFRELLAGDNEEALWSRSTERNLATAAFTLGLTAQQERLRLAAEHSEGTHTPAVVAALAAKAVLEGRPRCAVAANAMPSSHPHLPFFIARHRDGHLDLYPYASQECLASFCCAIRHGQNGTPGGGSGSGTSAAAAGGGIRATPTPPSAWAAWGMGPSSGSSLPGASTSAGGGAASAMLSYPSSAAGSGQRMERHAVTPVAFSPNGYIIAVGLSDGSVAGWRFAAAAVESPPAFTFPQIFAPYGIRACTFCGDRSSLMAVVGVTREPHPHPRVRVNGAVAAGHPTTLSSFFAMPPITPQVLPGVRATMSTGDSGELVGEVVILDTTLDDGAVTARCALPFVPSYAVYLTPLCAVLMASSEGLMATYCVPTGRLAVLATTTVTSVLSTLLGPSSADGAAGSAVAGIIANTAAAAAPGSVDSAAVYVTCLAKSAYDPLVAFGTSKGLVLLLHLRHISAAMQEAERRTTEEGEDVFVYYPPAATASTTQTSWTTMGKGRSTAVPLSTPVSATSRAATEVPAPAMGTEFLKRLPQESVLRDATCVQVAPQVHSRSAVEDVVFSPSMLLAGLRDGRVMAAAIIAQATRTHLTAGSSVAVELLEVSEGKASSS